MTLNDLLQICFAQGCDGKDTDIAICSVAINALQAEMPVLALQMPSVEQLAVMMKSADHVHVFIERGVFHLNALYHYKDNFPAARIYYLKTEDIMAFGTLGIVLQQHGITLPPVNGAQFSQLIDDRHYPQRFKHWHADYQANNKIFSDLLDGRMKNTAVERGIWLSANGKCLICGKATDRMSTSTLLGEQGTMIGLQLCEQHEREAAAHKTIVAYLAEKLGIALPFAVQDMGEQHGRLTLELTCEALKNTLECEIEKITGQTITARRQSGAKIIIR